MQLTLTFAGFVCQQLRNNLRKLSAFCDDVICLRLLF